MVSTMIEGISASAIEVSFISPGGAKRQTLFTNTTKMVLESSSINDHLEEGPDPIQVDQIRDEFIGLSSNHEVFEPREV